MTSSESVQLMAPAATKITLLPPKCPPSKSVIVGRGQLRVPRSVQLQLARSLTFGVLGDDSNLYPSSNWVSENRDNYAGRTADEAARTKPDFMITSLDTRKHNPQPTQIYHIRRINKQPVCNVQSWVNVGEKKEERPETSVYKVSYQDRPSQPVNIVHKQDLDKPIDGIVPVNSTGSKFDVRSEMMLPVCDASRMPSAPNPHRYLLRKRKVPPPFNTHTTTYTATSGIVYPNLEHSRMTSYDPGMQQTGSLPFPNESPQTVVPKETSDRTSVSSLSGYSFSRRKYIQPPSCHIFKGFDGGIAETTSRNFDDKYLPFIRAKTII